jgi:uncharacterized protein
MGFEIQKLPKPLQRKGIAEKLSVICQKNDIIFLAIFGSFVRGEQRRRSDVDIAIEFDKTKAKSLFDLLDAEDELSQVFKRKVDLGIFSSLKPGIAEDVKKEMCVIYQKAL